jgi:predicted secreted protein
MTFDIPLERSRRVLQIFFRPHLDRRSSHKIMAPQSRGSPNFVNFETPETKCNLDVGPVASHRVYYKGEGGGFPQVWAVVSLVNSSLPVVRLSTKGALVMH